MKKKEEKKKERKEKATRGEGKGNRKDSGTMIFRIEVTASPGCVPGETGFPGSESHKQRTAKNGPGNSTICLWI